MKNIPFILILPLMLLSACGKESDTTGITYRNYLKYEITRAESFLETVTEGTEEGQYQEGSIAFYLDEIQKASLVCDDPGSVQSVIDMSYRDLLKASEDFFDRMVPFKSIFQELISDAEFTLTHTEEGTTEGNAKPGSKVLLERAIQNAKTTLALPGLTQRMINADQTALINAIHSFDNNIIGRANLFMENQGFEQPGFNTTDFTLVPGWKLFGKLETWAPRAEIYRGGTSLLPAESVPEGEFVLKLGSYTQGIYQQMNERLHPNVTYTLDFKASLLMNNEDAFGNRHNVVVLSRLVIFRKGAGEYLFADILSESYDTLGLDTGGFQHIEHDIQISGTHPDLEAKFAVDFLVRHSFDATKPIWAEAYVALDDIKIFREQQ